MRRLFWCVLLAGIVTCGALGASQVNNRVMMEFPSNVDNPATVWIKRIPSHTGGTTGGFVGSGLRVESGALAGDKNFEWAGTFLMDNYSAITDAAENLAIYAETKQYSSGSSWIANLVFTDRSGLADQTGSHIGIELGYFANGTDANKARIAQDIIIGRYNTSGTNVYVSRGITLRGKETETNETAFLGKGIEFGPRLTFDTAIDLSSANVTTAALHLADNQRIYFDTAGSRSLRFSFGTLVYTNNAGLSTLLAYDNGDLWIKGHLRSNSGSSPTVSACGTSPAISGSDMAGRVTTGSTATTTCTIVFVVPYANQPYCVASPDGSANSGLYVSTSNSELVLTYSSATSAKFTYHCTAQNGG